MYEPEVLGSVWAGQALLDPYQKSSSNAHLKIALFDSRSVNPHNSKHGTSADW